jgi:hypothetical protein
MTEIPVVLAGTTAILLSLLSNRIAQIITLAAQYVAVAWLSSMALPQQVAAVKLVGGLIACGILGITAARGDPQVVASQARQRTRFRFAASVLVLVAAIGIGQANWMQIPEIQPAAIRGSTVLIALGLLHLGLFGTSFRIAIGLITLLSGFEIAYSVIEPSLAVLALIASVHIGLAMVVTYLDLVTGLEGAEQ